MTEKSGHFRYKSSMELLGACLLLPSLVWLLQQQTEQLPAAPSSEIVTIQAHCLTSASAVHRSPA